MIVGTAGHIDHGKTSLVRLLTGIDTDRLPEEKQRGMTIDLGFAHTVLARVGQIGIVDVPGHERFIRNMVAGATGIDLVLLVVAADDGVMPQTREHLDIIGLLGITSGIVALTKTDLVSAERIDAVTGEIRALLDGTTIASAPIVPISSGTGEGLEALRQELDRCLALVRSRSAEWPFWMPVDRVFVVRGFGVVATGTIESGEIKTDAQLRLLPGTQTVRVRGIQVHDRPVDAATAGNRCALNLTGIEKHSLRRGMVVCDAGLTRVAKIVDAKVTLAQDLESPLKNHVRVRIHCGTAEAFARLQWLESIPPESGGTGLAQLRLEEPVPLLYGLRFILRDQTAQRTVGGGVALDPFAEHRGARLPMRIERLRRLSALDPDETLSVLLETRGADGWLLPELAERLVEAPQRLKERVDRRSDTWREFIEGTVWIALRSAVEAMGPKLVSAIGSHLRDHPRATAVALATLHSTVCPRLDLRIFRLLLDRLMVGGGFELCPDGVRPVGHRQSFSREDTALADRVENLLAHHGKPLPKLEMLARAIGLATPRLRQFLGELDRAGRVTRLSDGVYVTRRDLTAWREDVQAHFRTNEQLSVAQFRDQVGIGRGLAIMVLERLDQEGVTKRVGEFRVAVSGSRREPQRASSQATISGQRK
ncbi:selenocysteine-specific translation elongation factor [Sulfuricaulis sp.]|jgi:selenocysteine-specific elongation factor|uniref:selenocysteine-specific translation elongation factor n=1 Tax=Sulfuricaulis sp. TaxID=2003553 RepID=UPI0035597AF3